MSFIKLMDIQKKFGQTLILDRFDLAINQGEFMTLLGPSGCGKTTCLRLIAGLEDHQKGKIFINEKCLSDPHNALFVPPENRNLGMVFQSYAVWPHMTVEENVLYPLKFRKLDRQSMRVRVDEILQLVQINDYRKRMPAQLSGGQQQRVALARALVMQPSVLLLDEPLSNLDAKLREKMRRDIREIQQKLKLTVVYVTHDQTEALTMSDRMTIMAKGEILQIGTPQEVQKNPASEFVADFIKT